MSLGVMENPDVNDKLPGKPEQTSDSDVCRGPSAVLGRPPLHARWYTTSLHSNQSFSSFEISMVSLTNYIYFQTNKETIIERPEQPGFRASYAKQQTNIVSFLTLHPKTSIKT